MSKRRKKWKLINDRVKKHFSMLETENETNSIEESIRSNSKKSIHSDLIEHCQQTKINLFG